MKAKLNDEFRTKMARNWIKGLVKQGRMYLLNEDKDLYQLISYEMNLRDAILKVIDTETANLQSQAHTGISPSPSTCINESIRGV